MKTPRFTIANNEMEQSEKWYVIHMQEPIFWAEIIHHDTPEQQSDFHNYILNFAAENKTGVYVGQSNEPEYLFTLVFFGEIHLEKYHRLNKNAGEIDKRINAQKESNEIAKIMREMTDFYIEYMKFEDNLP